MATRVLAGALLCAGLLLPVAAHAEPAAGKRKAVMCASCHGMDGIGTNPTVPNLAGNSEIYLMAQLKAFRAGTRQQEQMSIIAQSLSDQDIRDLADYYAAIKVSVTVPEF